MEAGDHALAAVRARDALLTDLQTFLPDAEGGWAAEQRRELDTLRLRGLETLAEAGLRQGGRELGAAEQAARAAIAAAPFRESAHRLLMEVHEAAGNPAEALRAFEELRSLLREELGTTPGQAAMTVFERVLRGEPAPAHRAPAPVAASPVALEPAPWPRAAGRRGGSPLADRARRRARLPGALLARGLRGTARAGAAGGRRRDRQDAARGRGGLPRVRGRRGGALRALRRGDAVALPAGGRDAARLVGGRAAGRPARPARARARRSSRSCCRSSGPRPPTTPPPAAAGTSSGAEADAQRFRFFDAVAALLGEIGAEAPVVLVFDDLQWADRPTLQLLRHLVRAPAPRRVLFLGTYRESEVSDRDPLHELIGDLRREGTLRRLELGGLRGARGGRAGGRAGPARRPRRRSCARWRARPRATRSSSRRSCATSATRRARCRRRSRSSRRACRTACARSPRGGCASSPSPRAPSCSWRR